jgi:GTP-binding protein
VVLDKDLDNDDNAIMLRLSSSQLRFSRSKLPAVLSNGGVPTTHPVSNLTAVDAAVSSSMPSSSSWQYQQLQQPPPLQQRRSFSSDDGGGGARADLRNISVIAHIDHGKTSLVSKLLECSSLTKNATDNTFLDSGDLERERGITITGKVTRIPYGNVTINCADTPGHADFSGEVDRYLSLSDGFLLVVDAAEGPKSQTKYVLSRALNYKGKPLTPILILNKCDREDAITKIDSGETEDKIERLMRQLMNGAEPPHYSTLYGSAKMGWITDDPLQAMEWGLSKDVSPPSNMTDLLDRIVAEVPPAAYDNTTDELRMAAVTVGHDSFLGRTMMGRIVSGSIAVGDSVQMVGDSGGSSTVSTISGVFGYQGLERTSMADVITSAGDIVTVTGVPPGAFVGGTLTKSNKPAKVAIVTPPLAPPTLSMDFGANDGPLSGQEGKHIASGKIRQRLLQETDNNVTLRVEPSATDAEKTIVYARGELQLGILIEQMRREGFELIVSPPRILTSKCPDTGAILEPYEEAIIDVDSEYAGTVISSLTGDRKGILLDMAELGDGKSQLTFEIPSRGLLGFNSEIATATKGSAVVNHLYIGDRVSQNLGVNLTKGKLVSNDTGKATGYALMGLAARGTLFIAPGDHIYNGMVIGENAKPGDMEVNAIRAKELTNMRTKGADEATKLPPAKRMPVEELIGYMEEDEVIEITPLNVRLRKQILDGGERERAARSKNKKIKAQRAA